MATFYRVRPLDEKIYRRASGSSDTLYVAFSISSALWWASSIMDDENVNDMIWAMDEIEIPDETPVAVFGDSWKDELLGHMTAGEAREMNPSLGQDAQVMVLEKGVMYPFRNIGMGISDQFINQTQLEFYKKYYNFISGIQERFNSVMLYWGTFEISEDASIADLIKTYNDIIDRAKLCIPILYDMFDFFITDLSEDELIALFGADFDKFVNAIGSAERIAKMQPKGDILDTVEARKKLLNQIGMLQIMYEGVYEKAIKFPLFALRALKDTFIGG